MRGANNWKVFLRPQLRQEFNFLRPLSQIRFPWFEPRDLSPWKVAEAASVAISSIFRRHQDSFLEPFTAYEIERCPHLSISAVMGSATNVYYTHWRGPRPLPHHHSCKRSHALFLPSELPEVVLDRAFGDWPQPLWRDHTPTTKAP